MDVHYAFSHGELDEEVYEITPWCQVLSTKSGVHLRKSLYDLKLATRCWFSNLKGSLLQYCFTQSYSDYSLITLHLDCVD